ncbi:hypothetical protein, partial [Erythrobacter sp.]
MDRAAVDRRRRRSGRARAGQSRLGGDQRVQGLQDRCG